MPDELADKHSAPEAGGHHSTRLILVQRTRVEQAIDQADFGSFNKEIIRAEAASGRSLGLVRKFRDDIPRVGAILLIHGFAQNRYTWHLSTRSLVNYLADGGLDVYNLELTGHGRSRDYGTQPAASFEEYLEDTVSVVRAVSDYSGLGKVFLMGHSLGGAVCYAVAPRLGEQLAGIATISGLFRFGSNPATKRLADVAGAMARFEPAIRKLGAGVRTSLLGRVIADQWEQAEDLSWSFPLAGWVPGSTEPEIVRERLNRGFDWTGVNILLTMMRWASEGSFTGRKGENYEEAFAVLDLPLLVVAADRDRMLPPEDARPAYDLSRSQDKTYKVFSPVREEVHWGHLDIILGRKAPLYVWPYLRTWLLDRCPPAEAPDPS